MTSVATQIRVRRRQGFTLVELLVVIGIIAILAGVSLGAYLAALSSARKAGCASNLRSIGVAMIDFAGDNNGCLPESGGTIPYNTVDNTTQLNGWCQQLEPYLGSGSGRGGKGTPFQCPDSSHVIAQNATYSYFNGAHAAHAQSGGFGAVRLVQMTSPSRHIIAGDIAFPIFTTTDADKDDYTQDPAFNLNAGKIPIHRGYVNLVFADGHVESVNKFDPAAMTTVYGDNNTTYLAP